MVVDFVMHGVIMADTYRRYPEVFTQEDAGPAWFALVSVLIGIALAILFARTRRSWAGGLAGGAVFGLLVGIITHFFANFFDALGTRAFPTTWRGAMAAWPPSASPWRVPCSGW
jgi:uncharacterized membrane protein YedE/YeeE